MPDQRDIVLIPVPFTDLTASKRRPVIVISNATYHLQSEDMLVVAMTSNPAATAHGFPLFTSDLEAGNLNRPGIVRPDKVFTLSRNLAVTVFGRVKLPVLERIRDAIQSVTNP